jgi:hypothetical protein
MAFMVVLLIDTVCRTGYSGAVCTLDGLLDEMLRATTTPHTPAASASVSK